MKVKGFLYGNDKAKLIAAGVLIVSSIPPLLEYIDFWDEEPDDKKKSDNDSAYSSKGSEEGSDKDKDEGSDKDNDEGSDKDK